MSPLQQSPTQRSPINSLRSSTTELDHGMYTLLLSSSTLINEILSLFQNPTQISTTTATLARTAIPTLCVYHHSIKTRQPRWTPKIVCWSRRFLSNKQKYTSCWVKEEGIHVFLKLFCYFLEYYFCNFNINELINWLI